MKNIIEYCPKFLVKLDASLRVNYPWLWATNIHVNLFTGIILIGVFSIIGFLIPVDIKEVPSKSFYFELFLLLMIPAIAWFVFLVRQLALFNVDKLFGKQSNYREFLVFVIYMVTFAMPACLPISTNLVLNERVKHLEQDGVFIKDCLGYNLGLRYFPTNESDFEYYPNDSVYKANKHHNVPDLISSVENVVIDDDATEAIDGGDNTYYDGNGVMRDSIYSQLGVFEHQRPHLYYDGGYNRIAFSDNDSVISDIAPDYHYARNIDRDFVVAEKDINAFCLLLKKYSSPMGINEKQVLADYKENNYTKSVADEYLSNPISDTHRNMDNIRLAKHNNQFFFDRAFWIVLFFMVFYVSILFNIFKQVHHKQFLLGLSIAAILVSVLGIFEAIFHADFFISGLFSISVCSLIYACVNFKTNRYGVLLNQTTIFLNIILPLIGVITYAFVEQSIGFFESSFFDSYKEWIKQNDGSMHLQYSSAYYTLKDTIEVSAIWGGIILYFFVWNTFLKKLYIRLWNLPKHR